MSGNFKKQLEEAFLKMPHTRLWGSRLKKFGILKFVSNCEDAYEKEREIKEAVKGISVGPRYY